MVADPQSRFRPRTDDDPVELADLLRRIGAGDETALTLFYRATSRRVLGLALQMLRDWQFAEEATLHVFDRVWRAGDSYRPDRGSPIVWLLALTRNRCIDVLRRPDRELPTADDIAVLASNLGARGPSPLEWVVDCERAELVRTAARELPRGQREAIAAAYFGGMSQSEIARTLDVPLGTVKARVRNGLHALRRALGILEAGES